MFAQKKKNDQTLCLILVEWTRIVWLMNTQLGIRTLYEINSPAMVSELPACLGHLLEDLGGVVGRAARTGMPPEQSSSPLPSPTPPTTFHQTFSGGRNLGINSFQQLAYSWLDHPIWLHLKSVSIPGCNKGGTSI